MASTKLILVKPVLIVSVIFLLWSPFLCGGTLSKSSPKKAKQKSSVPADAESSSNSPTKSVFDRGLVKEKFKINDLITHHSTVCPSCVKTRQFSSGMALAYVTPWNNRRLLFRYDLRLSDEAGAQRADRVDKKMRPSHR